MNEIEHLIHVSGKHEFCFVPPDQVRFVMCGVFEDADAVAYLDFIQVHAHEGSGLLYGVYDLTHMTRMDEGARKRVVNVGQSYSFGGIAVIGASFSMRTLASMLLRAGKLLAPKYFNFPHKFVASMDDANAWFDELRRKQVSS